MDTLDFPARGGHHGSQIAPETAPQQHDCGPGAPAAAFAGTDMSRYELLDNVTHQDLRVSTLLGTGIDDPVGLVPAWPTEFAELQREYPIFLRRDEADGSFQAVALLGFDAGENLFIGPDGWNTSYLPGAVARGPFAIGFQEQLQGGMLQNEPVIHVDVDHPRVARDGDGTPVFLPHGGHSPYLEHVLTVLKGIHDGAEAARALYPALDALGLIQPVELDLQFDQEHHARLTGLYGIDRDRLAALDAQQLHGLHTSGMLEGIYLMLCSMYNVRHMIAEKQRRLRAQAGAEAGRAG